MSPTGNHCLINQSDCGRVAGNPVCQKCGMDERVVYPGQADLEVALEAARARYLAAQDAVEPPPPPEPPKPPTPPEQPPQSSKQPDPEPSAPPSSAKNGANRLGLVVLVMALLGGGRWWKDQQDQRLQQAEEQAASQALAVEQARSEREAEKKRADEAEAKRMAAEKAQAQMAEKAAEVARQAEAERAAQLAREKQAALGASKLTQPPLAPPPTKPVDGASLHGRYQILAGGSEVKDVQTGLIWQRCSVGQAWNGSTCTGQAKTFTFVQAQQLAGNGWRVPTVRELASLIYCSTGEPRDRRDPKDGGGPIASVCVGDHTRPSIRSEAFPNTPHTLFLASGPYEGDSSGHWIVGFGYGYANPSNARESHHVRMVRTSQ